MKVNDVLHGFCVQYIQPLPELKATLYRMRYEKNGADLVWLDREDDNKTFAITFKTLPQDDTGVFHILEHSVLCGSKKYPVKEPFVELLKSSLQTFMNAFTFPDKTMYPVSSCNHQDFLNLVDVYMDAVLHPLSITTPEAFLQEGWHYELSSPDGELKCNGVVYNEMKGAYASPDELLQSEMDRLLFPDNCYGFESGGHPDHITELTYENYLASHQRFYHPSNARIFLDGRVDLDAVLAKLDGFLEEYDYLEVDASIPMQASVAPGEFTCPYEIDAQDDGENKLLLAGGWLLGTFEQQERIMACTVLNRALCASNESPLKKALLERGLAEDVELQLVDGIQQPYVILVVRNTSLEKKAAVWQTVEETLTQLAEQGLDHDRLQAILNRLEFISREKDYGSIPRGVAYAIGALESWLYGGDPAQNLCYDEAFAALRQGIDTGLFETLLREIWLDNPHRARLCLVPSNTLGEEKRAAEQRRLAGIKAGWSEEEIARVMAEFDHLRACQERTDTPEALATLPVLSLADIPEQVPPLRQQVLDLDGTTVLHHDVETDGITYLDLYFSLADLSVEEMGKVSLLAGLLGQMATQRYTPIELRSRIESSLGRLNARTEVYAKGGQTEECEPYLNVSVSLLEHRKAQARDLVSEVLRTSRFDDTRAVCNLLRQRRLGLEQAMVDSGHAYAARRCAAQCSAKGTVEEALKGISMLRWLQGADKAFAQEGEGLCRALAELCGRIFLREKLTISLTGKLDLPWLKEILDDLPSAPERVGDRAVYAPKARLAEGFQIPAEVGFAARCWNLNLLEECYSGAGRVAAQMLTFGHLWNNVRVKGGAYGTELSVRPDGAVNFISYRDPRCAQSLDCFAAAGQALREFCDSGESPDKCIISTIGEMESLLSPSSRGAQGAAIYFNGRTQEDRQRLRSQVLHTTAEDLRQFSQVLDRLCADAAVCVIGGKQVLDECGDKLERRETLQ